MVAGLIRDERGVLHRLESGVGMTSAVRILVADDDESVRRLLGEILSRAGYQYTLANSGSEALEALRRQRFDVLVADIKMAGNVHLELVKEVPHLAEGMPVILITGYPSLDTAIGSLQLPVVDYLIKPFDQQTFLDVISKAVERSRLYRSVAATRLRCEGLSAELKTLLAGLVERPRTAQTEALASFLTVVLGNVFAALKELETLVGPPSETALSEAGASEVLAAQRQLIRDTLRVLEKTKSAFKSKELGQLRKKIEAFLKTH